LTDRQLAADEIGLVRISTDLRVLETNAGFASMLLDGAEEVAGSPISRYFHEDDAGRVRIQLLELLTGAVDAVAFDCRGIRPDKSTIRLHWTAIAGRADDGRFGHIIAMVEDTTAEHQADVAAARNLNLLERLNRLKTEFLTTVSHEFRTALVGIQGFSELLRDSDSLNLAEVRSYANEVYNDARRLDHMLDKMLALDQAEGSRSVLHIGTVDLNSAVRDAIAGNEGGLGHQVVTDLDPGLPSVKGDRAKLSQLVSILLSNAVKFSPEASRIVVSSRFDGGCVLVSMRDHGAGMPADFDRQLFGRFEWGADNPTSKVIGSGLGLPMAHEIVELHGGKIWFERVAGGGSEFHFTIPTFTHAALPRRAATPEPGRQSQRQSR
jgi:signal transduction histidine kinase